MLLGVGVCVWLDHEAGGGGLTDVAPASQMRGKPQTRTQPTRAKHVTMVQRPPMRVVTIAILALEDAGEKSVPPPVTLRGPKETEEAMAKVEPLPKRKTASRGEPIAERGYFAGDPIQVMGLSNRTILHGLEFLGRCGRLICGLPFRIWHTVDQGSSLVI